jgi:hypothetical protein
MKSFYKSVGFCLLIALIAPVLILTGCGGGGGGGSEDLGAGGSTGSGNVALLLADGPADDYDGIWIWVTRVILIPSDVTPGRSPVTIFESDEGYRINLLELRDEDFLLTLKKRVPAGWYSKIRLEVKKVFSLGGPCNNFKLPSNRIDLNPRGPFEVRSGETIAIRMDIDANKSINLHEAGNSGKCIFRPVVFVDIDTIVAPQRCPRILVGEITELLPDESNIEGFTLDLSEKRGAIHVRLSEDPRKLTVIYGEDGFRVRRSALEVGQKVRVTGRITSNGDLTASVVIIGDVLNIKGTVVSSVGSDSTFPLLLDTGQELIGDQVTVEVTNGTLILTGCDEEVGIEAIQRGKRARIIGKHDVEENVFRALAIILKSEEIIGDLESIERATGGITLNIKDESGIVHSVFLPEETPIYLQGDGEIAPGLLNQILSECGPKVVRVELDPEEVEPTAQEVRVQQERLYGRVVEILRNRTVRLRTGQLVRVQEGATIMLNTRGADIRVDFDSIRIGDELTLFGLSACEDLDADFYAYIVLVNDSATDCDDDCDDDYPKECTPVDTLPGLVTDNDVKICLDSGKDYQSDLMINGNNFALIGEAGKNCADDTNWTILTGDVTVNGNNTVFKNIKFKGDLDENGNNTRFINSCFEK